MAKCYHQSVRQYDELEVEETGEIIDIEYEICNECKAIIAGNGKIVGYDK